MILINILLVLLIFLILSDLYIKYSPKSKLNLVPINYKIKKKDGLNELTIDLKITNKSKTKETMVSNMNFELDFFKNKGNEYCQNFHYQEDIYIFENNKIKNLNNYWPTTIIKSNSELFVRIKYKFSNNNFRKKNKISMVKNILGELWTFWYFKKQGLFVN